MKLFSTRRAGQFGMSGMLGAVSLALVLAGCGSSDSPSQETGGSAVLGVVSSDVALSGTVALKDSSTPVQERTATLGDNGAFSFDITGMKSPYLLRVESGNVQMYTVSPQGGRANISPITDVAVAAAEGDGSAADDFARGDGQRHRQTAANFANVVAELKSVLKPLFDLYQVPADPFTDDGVDSALRAMFADIRVEVIAKNVVVTNRKMGGVIFTGPLADLASGTFSPENMPGGSAPSDCAYTYSAWGACQSNDTQARTVTSASPAGCTGTPVLSQSCTYVPLPGQCTYTYSAWGACQSNGTQARTVTSSSPAGCTGTPVLSQSCTYVPPIDGAALYTSQCAGCHGTLPGSKKGASAATIQSAINNNRGGMGQFSTLTAAQVQAIADAIK